MAPKKKEAAQKMSLGDFLSDQNFGGSWADEVEDTYGEVGTQALPPSERKTYGSSSGYGSGYGNDRGGDRGAWGGGERSYAPRDSGPARLPDKPPYTAHLGNLSYDATVDTVNEFFEGCSIINVRIIEDREQQRPKGFAYAEFADVDGLKKALELDGESFQGRTIRITIADPPRDGGRGESNRDLSDWTRKGPLADLPNRGGNDRRGGDFGGDRPDRPERRPFRDAAADDGRTRDFGNWERKGPLSPLAQPEGGPGGFREREGSRPRNHENRTDSFRDRHQAPAAWGEGAAARQEARQEAQEARQDSRPPRREFAERPERPERVPTAAEKDTQWRNNMRPDGVKASPGQSRDGSEAPASPGATTPAAPVGRPRLNLAKRTVSEAPDALSPSTAGDAKASPFGAARPINTAQREKEIEEKREQHLKEKRDAEEKAKEEKRLAKEAAAKEAEEKAAEAAKAEAAAVEAPATAANEEPKTTEASEEKIPVRSKGPREGAPPLKTRPSDTGNWRQASGELRSPRMAPAGPRRGGAGGAARGGRSDGPRPPRANGSPAQAAAAEGDAEPSTPKVEDDGWTTVTLPKKGRGGRA